MTYRLSMSGLAIHCFNMRAPNLVFVLSNTHSKEPLTVESVSFRYSSRLAKVFAPNSIWIRDENLSKNFVSSSTSAMAKAFRCLITCANATVTHLGKSTATAKSFPAGKSEVLTWTRVAEYKTCCAAHRLFAEVEIRNKIGSFVIRHHLVKGLDTDLVAGIRWPGPVSHGR